MISKTLNAFHIYSTYNLSAAETHYMCIYLVKRSWRMATRSLTPPTHLWGSTMNYQAVKLDSCIPAVVEQLETLKWRLPHWNYLNAFFLKCLLVLLQVRVLSSPYRSSFSAELHRVWAKNSGCSLHSSAAGISVFLQMMDTKRNVYQGNMDNLKRMLVKRVPAILNVISHT